MSDFMNGFCKVEFLCYSGEPNWLGMVVLAVGGLIVTFPLYLLLTEMAKP